MIESVIIVFLVIFAIISILAALALLSFKYYIFSLGMVIVVGLLYIAIYVVFNYSTRKIIKKNILQLKKINVYKMYVKRDDSENLIEFNMNNDSWMCTSCNDICFDLKGYLFKKSFILASIIRNTRYKTVSQRLPFSFFFRKKLELDKECNNLVVRFLHANRIKEYVIVKNNQSINTFFTSYINQIAIFHENLNGVTRYRTFSEGYPSFKKRVIVLNEKIFIEKALH